MKKAMFAVMAAAIVLSSGLTVFAAPEKMADGTVFDAEYYAQSNPDITAVYGTDKEKLFQHYAMCGKAEGRKAYAGQEVSVTRFGVLLEPGDENYLRMGRIMTGFDYDLTPRTERIWYTFGENGRLVEHREPLETPFVSDPADGFVRSDWSGDPRYQALRNEIIQIITERGAGAEIKGETLSLIQRPRSEEESNELNQMLKNLSIDLMKGGILDNCYLSWGSANGYIYFESWGYDKVVDVFANLNDATTSMYDKHPEIWNYMNKSRDELYDDSAEMADDEWGGDWIS